MSRAQSFLTALALAALTPLSAAGILTVGPPGSGAQFEQIQAAVDAAQDGDVILVEPGTYAKIVVDKPLRILGVRPDTVVISAVADIGVTIRDIGLGEELVLSAVEVASIPFVSPPASIKVHDCLGTVILHDVLVEQLLSGVGVLVEDCGRVLLLDSRILEAGVMGTKTIGAVLVQDSDLWIANSTIRGGTKHDFVAPGAPGVEAVGATLRVWRSTIVGGDGGGLKPTFGLDGSGGAAVLARSSTVAFFGGPTAELRGGNGFPPSFFGPGFPGGPGLDLGESSAVAIQADIPIEGGFDGEGLIQADDVESDGTAAIALVPAVFPSLVSSVQQASGGTTFELTLAGNPGAFELLFLSIRTGPTLDFPGVAGSWLLDPVLFFQVGAQVLPPSGAELLPFFVPDDPTLLGTTLLFQSAEVFGSAVSLSNPALVTVTS